MFSSRLSVAKGGEKEGGFRPATKCLLQIFSVVSSNVSAFFASFGCPVASNTIAIST